MAYFRKVKDSIAPKGYMSRLKSVTVRIFISDCTGQIFRDGYPPSGRLSCDRLGAAPFRDSLYAGRVML
jgi:hypothetical protein